MHTSPGVSGGALLRALRERAKKPQLIVEADADLGTGYLQRIESGKVRQPARSTLERILAVLDARYGEQRTVLELYGYTITTPLPNVAEIDWARTVCQNELHEVAFPAYVLDCGHRLIGWNRFVPLMFGVAPDSREMMDLECRCLLHAWFDTYHWLAPLVVNQAEFFPALMRAFRYEMQVVGDEAWTTALLESLLELPVFQQYWSEPEVLPIVAARALIPIQLDIPHRVRLQFRLTAESFTADSRFRIVYYLPADTQTIRQCADWAEQTDQEGVLD